MINYATACKRAASLKTKIIFTCEHAFYNGPKALSDVFPKSLLKSHYGWDEGAKSITESLASKTKGKVFLFPWSRLFIDANRRLNNKAIHPKNLELFGGSTQRLIKDYENYRKSIFSQIKKELDNKNKVLIFSVHSFVPTFKDKKRKTDLGLLFRPGIKKELLLAQNTKKYLKKENHKLNIHFNRPYRGHTDCFLNDLLDKYKSNSHVNGLFLEFNQSLLKKKAPLKDLLKSLESFLLSIEN